MSQLTAAQGIDDSQTQTGFGNSPFKTTQRQYTWQNEFALPVGALTAGYERREERVDTDAAFATTSRDTDSLFGIYQLRVDAHALQANLRHDESSQYGGKTTGAIAYSYRLAPAWRLTAGYSTGFKAPSFNDLYYPGFSNPDLVPETSHNVEGGVYWNGDAADASVEARAIGYRNRIERTDRVPVRRRFQLRAAERRPCDARRRDAGRRLRAVDGVADRGVARPAVADRTTAPATCCRGARGSTARWRVGYPIGPGASRRSRSSPRRCATTTRRTCVKMGGYAIVNLTAEWTVERDVTLFVRANNVLDKNYELAAGYATGGANVFAGMRAQFR